MLSRPSVSRKREEVNCVPLSVVSVRFAARLPSGSRARTPCSTAARASSVRQRCETSQPTVFRPAVDHTHQVRLAYCGPRLDFRHVRSLDLIRLAGFHAAPLFLVFCAQTPRAHQQPAFAHYPHHTHFLYPTPLTDALGPSCLHGL